MEGVKLVINVVHPEPRDIPQGGIRGITLCCGVGTPSYLASAVDGITAMLGVTKYISNHVLSVAHVASCMCYQLHMLPVAHVTNCTCYKLHMLPVAHVTSCTCWPVASVASCACSQLQVLPVAHVASCTCCQLHM